MPEVFQNSMPKQIKLLDAELKLLDTVWTDNNLFRFDNLPEGAYMLSLELTNGKNYQKTIVVSEEEQIVNFDLSKSGKKLAPKQRLVVKGELRKKTTEDSLPISKKFIISQAIEFKVSEIQVLVFFHDTKSPAEVLKTLYVRNFSSFSTDFKYYSDTSAKMFLFLSDLFPPKLVSCPPDSELRVHVSYDKTPFHPLKVKVTTNNYPAEAILDLINNGGIKEAKTLMNKQEAEQLLKEKRNDCSAAAIGGYYLLKTGELPRLHDWANNLAEWFPYLPDGAIIHAWQMICGRYVDQTFIRKRLLDAVKRGVPVYTEGLRLLYDGLYQLTAIRKNDSELREALILIRELALNADWTTSVTSINNFEPGLKPGDQIKYLSPTTQASWPILQNIYDYKLRDFENR